MPRPLLSIIFCLLLALALPLFSPASENGPALLLRPIINLEKNKRGDDGRPQLVLPEQMGPAELAATSPLFSGPGGLGDLDIFALSVGASFSFSDWLGFDATYAVPLREEELSRQDDNYTLEAMVTMQF
ncbi:MAG: hypothetical protein ABFR97_00130 [Thermodesulfobacteriota bacterium]